MLLSFVQNLLSAIGDYNFYKPTVTSMSLMTFIRRRTFSSLLISRVVNSAKNSNSVWFLYKDRVAFTENFAYQEVWITKLTCVSHWDAFPSMAVYMKIGGKWGIWPGFLGILYKEYVCLPCKSTKFYPQSGTTIQNFTGSNIYSL